MQVPQFWRRKQEISNYIVGAIPTDKRIHVSRQDIFTETENISYHVAAGNIDKELLHEIMESIMRGDFEENEDVKFKYYTAISGLEV